MQLVVGDMISGIKIWSHNSLQEHRTRLFLQLWWNLSRPKNDNLKCQNQLHAPTNFRAKTTRQYLKAKKKRKWKNVCFTNNAKNKNRSFVNRWCCEETFENAGVHFYVHSKTKFICLFSSLLSRFDLNDAWHSKLKIVSQVLKSNFRHNSHDHWAQPQ